MPPDVTDPVVRGFFGLVIVALLVAAFACLAYISKGGESDEYYAAQMRYYRYGTSTNTVWAKLYYRRVTNILDHGNIKRELVYLQEVCEPEGRTNQYVLSEDYVSDRILPLRSAAK